MPPLQNKPSPSSNIRESNSHNVIPHPFPFIFTAMSNGTNIGLMWQKRLDDWYGHNINGSMNELRAEFERTVKVRQDYVFGAHGLGLPTLRLVYLIERAVWRFYWPAEPFLNYDLPADRTLDHAKYMLSHVFEPEDPNMVLLKPVPVMPRADRTAWDDHKQRPNVVVETVNSDWFEVTEGPIYPRLYTEIQPRYLTPDGRRVVEVIDELRNCIPKLTLEERAAWEAKHRRKMLPPMALQVPQQHVMEMYPGERRDVEMHEMERRDMGDFNLFPNSHPAFPPARGLVLSVAELNNDDITGYKADHKRWGPSIASPGEKEKYEFERQRGFEARNKNHPNEGVSPPNTSVGNMVRSADNGPVERRGVLSVADLSRPSTGAEVFGKRMRNDEQTEILSPQPKPKRVRFTLPEPE